MDRKELLRWIWLSSALGYANAHFSKLLAYYPNPTELFDADESALSRISELSPRTKEKLRNKDLSGASEILDTCQRLGIGILPYADLDYPALLREIPAPPVLLYYKGTLPDWNRTLSIGMVGTRRMSAYGLRSAYKIAYELASADVLVVSGMAAGIDGVAAAAALKGGGRTIAVLGSGIDVVYPKHHSPLSDEIAKNGLLLSEYPPGTRPNSYHFPARNRIISGLSRAIVVVEAGVKSGSLITAKDAVVQGRDVFAVPANVGNTGAEGTNGLLIDGAKPALNASDILFYFDYVYSETLSKKGLHRTNDILPDLAYLKRLGVVDTETSEKGTEVTSKGTVRRSEKSEAQLTRTAPVPKQEEPSAIPSPKKAEGKTPDQILHSLSPIQLSLLQAIPDDRAISADALCNLGYPHGQTLAALTMLEIMGLVQKLPGALYKKA